MNTSISPSFDKTFISGLLVILGLLGSTPAFAQKGDVDIGNVDNPLKGLFDGLKSLGSKPCPFTTEELLLMTSQERYSVVGSKDPKCEKEMLEVSRILTERDNQALERMEAQNEAINAERAKNYEALKQRQVDLSVEDEERRKRFAEWQQKRRVEEKEKEKRGILADYDSTPASHSMVCDTRQTGYIKYEVVGDFIVVNNTKVQILEKDTKKGLFAGTFNSLIGKVTLIVDYKNKKVTQKTPPLNEIFDCL